MAKKVRISVAPKKSVKEPATVQLKKESQKIKKNRRVYKTDVKLTAHIKNGK